VSDLVKIRWRTPLPWILVAAGLMRVLSVMAAGGFRAVFLYDDGVYYSAAAGLANGVMPYRDFLLVHPPGSTLAYAPFASLGHVIPDSTAFAIARCEVIAIGVFNTWLVWRVAARVGKVASVTAAGMYAVWFPVIFVERTTLLEPFVILGTLASLALMFATKPKKWHPWVAGIVVGFGVATKLWALVPFAVIVVAVLLAKRYRDALQYLVAGTMTGAIIVGPFFLVAPTAMYRMIITDQLGRAGPMGSPTRRFIELFNLRALHLDPNIRVFDVPLLIALVLLVGIIGTIFAWRRYRQTRLWVILLGIQVSVLLWLPVYFTGYSSFAAPALVLSVGSIAQVAWSAEIPRVKPAVSRAALAVCAGVGAVSCGIYVAMNPHAFGPLSSTAVASVAPGNCVASDRPATTIVANKLTSDLVHRCPVEFDVIGPFYETNDFKVGTTSRRKSPSYQRYLQGYFAGNDYVIISRPAELSRSTRALLDARPVVYRSHHGRVTIYGPPHPD